MADTLEVAAMPLTLPHNTYNIRKINYGDMQSMSIKTKDVAPLLAYIAKTAPEERFRVTSALTALQNEEWAKASQLMKASARSAYACVDGGQVHLSQTLELCLKVLAKIDGESSASPSVSAGDTPLAALNARAQAVAKRLKCLSESGRPKPSAQNDSSLEQAVAVREIASVCTSLLRSMGSRYPNDPVVVSIQSRISRMDSTSPEENRRLTESVDLLIRLVERLYDLAITKTSTERECLSTISKEIMDVLSHSDSLETNITGGASEALDGFQEEACRLIQKKDSTLLAEKVRAFVGQQKDIIAAQNRIIESQKKDLRKIAETNRAIQETLSRTEQEATEDPLTGLFNRRAYDEAVARMLVAHSNPKSTGELGLILVDIDRFKPINDNYGHLFGDKIIRRISKTLKEVSEAVGGVFPCRYGGEEFALLVSSKSNDKLSSISRELLNKVRDLTFEFEGEVIKTTISIGLSCAKTGDTPQDLFARADRALYKSKASGRDQIWSSAEVA